MIRTETLDGWLITYQPAHAMLSTSLAAEWARLRPEPWTEVLVAVSQHDNGWAELDDAPTVLDDGTPRDFLHMALDAHLAMWERGIARARMQGLWPGLLVSHHATALYGGRAGSDSAIDDFLTTQQAQQRAWTEALGTDEAAVQRAYRMIALMDWFSLVLCLGRGQAEGEPVTLGKGPTEEPLTLRWLAPDRATVSPWPFAAPTLSVGVETLRLDTRTFATDAALRAALTAAPRFVRQWAIVAPTSANQ